MIFVTVGTQLPFDRLIRAVDEIAPFLNGERIVAQTHGGNYIAKNIECRAYMYSDEFNAVLNRSRMIISHAGIGSIMSALTLRLPIIVMPRRASLGEVRNNHQLATAKKMNELELVNVAYDEKQLQKQVLSGNIHYLRPLPDKASDELIESIVDFIQKK